MLDAKLNFLYLQREEELLSCWWKEYAECNEGPRGPGIVSNPSSSESGQLYVTEEERVGVPVKGGLYEVFIFFWQLS